MQPLQTYFKITLGGVDATKEISEDLLSLTYTDKESGEADEIELTLKDETGKWAGSWQPTGGEIITATLQSGTTTKKGRSLNCGKFYVDSQSISGAPRVYNLKGVSVPLNTPIRKKIKTRAWEYKDLENIARKIAKENGLSFSVYASVKTPLYDRKEQKRESDLHFLMGLCNEAGICVKITNAKIVLFTQSLYETKKPVKTITLNSSDVLSYDFENNQSEKYKSVTVSYRDPKRKFKVEQGGNNTGAEGGRLDYKKQNTGVFEYTYTDPEVDENGQEFGMKSRAKSLDEAKRLAKAKLRDLNRRAITGNISMIGDVTLCAGSVIAIKGFGSFDGNFIIEQATHSLSNSGYTTALQVRRVNTKY